MEQLTGTSDDPDVGTTKTQDPTISWYWVPASNGKVPANAVVGGFDGVNLYIARANHKGEVVPGKLHPPSGSCYIPWGGSEHRKTNYEVLCNAKGKFVHTSGSSIPNNAYIGGYSTVNNEPYYIGRVNIYKTLTLGKVSRMHGLCYIPYGGKELYFTEYEIYVSQ